METPKIPQEFPPSADRDQRIKEDISQLISKHRSSRSLTPEVCRLLFYRYGEVPNANRVYGLTRKGSLTTITEEVANFWKDIRGQSHIQIPCPGLSNAAADKLGNFLSGLIQEIETRLSNELEAHRETSRNEIRKAHLAAEQAENALQTARNLASEDRQSWEAERQMANLRETQLLKELAAEQSTSSQLRAEMEAWTNRATEAQAQLRHAQDMFTNELSSIRKALELSESRAVGAEQRALEHIEEERQEQRKLASRLAHADKQADLYASKYEKQSAQILALTTEAAMLKGRLAAVEEDRVRLQSEVQRLTKGQGRTGTKAKKPKNPQT